MSQKRVWKKLVFRVAKYQTGITFFFGSTHRHGVEVGRMMGSVRATSEDFHCGDMMYNRFMLRESHDTWCLWVFRLGTTGTGAFSRTLPMDGHGDKGATREADVTPGHLWGRAISKV